MTIPRRDRWIWAAAALLLAACHSQPSVVASNAATQAELAEINDHTNAADGMDQGNDLLMATPSAGQQMNAQPPKR